MRLRLFGLGCLLLICSGASIGKAPAATQGKITFETEYQERRFQIKDGVFTTQALVNKLPSSTRLVLPRLQPFRVERTSSSEFGLAVAGSRDLTAYDFIYRDHRVEQTSDGDERLVVHLEGRTVPLNITLVYSAKPGEHWMRKFLEITPRTPEDKKYVVERIDVERLGLAEGGEGGGIGQPIFFPRLNYFFGLEYPEGHNDHAGVVTLTHFPGKPVGERLESKSAVWGVAPDGQAVREFLESYVPSFAVHYRRQPVITFNEAWNSGSSTNSAIAAESISTIKDQLVDKRNVNVNVYMIDAGWADPASILAIDRTRFPEGFRPIEKDAERSGMELGLWSSLVGADLDTHWGMARGMEAVRGNEVFGPYCLADPKYHAALKTALGQLVSEGVRSFKFDYNSFDCTQSEGNQTPQAREAAVDAYVDILAFLHDSNPDIKIEITTGMWLSPWWLRYSDWVWLGGSDLDFLTPSGIPSLEVKKPQPISYTRPQEISYRDSVMWNDFRKERFTFPAWGVMTHGFYNWLLIGNAPDPEAGLEAPNNCCNEPLPDFADHVVMVLMRGISDWEMLLDLHSMTAEKWNYLARALKWGQMHWDVLSHTQMVLGNPSQFEVYGYTHFNGTRGIVSLRNPASFQQTAEIALTPENGFWGFSSEGQPASQIYPCDRPMPGFYHEGSRIKVTLRPYETEVIELGDFPKQTESLAAGGCTGF